MEHPKPPRANTPMYKVATKQQGEYLIFRTLPAVQFAPTVSKRGIVRPTTVFLNITGNPHFASMSVDRLTEAIDRHLIPTAVVFGDGDKWDVEVPVTGIFAMSVDEDAVVMTLSLGHAK